MPTVPSLLSVIGATVPNAAQLNPAAARDQSAIRTEHSSYEMKRQDLKSMSVDELWSLHQIVASVLAGKLSAKSCGLRSACASWANLAGSRPTSRCLTRDDLIRRCFRSIEIRRSPQRPGRAAESSRAG